MDKVTFLFRVRDDQIQLRSVHSDTVHSDTVKYCTLRYSTLF